VWYGICPHEGWDMRWYFVQTYQTDGNAIGRARKLEKESKAVRVVQHWWDGKSFQVEVIYEKMGNT